MLRLLKALPLTLAIAAVSILATGCSSGNGTHARFVNAISNTDQYNGGALNVEVNGTQQFTDVPFPQASGSYTNIPSGNDTFEGFEYPGVITSVFTDSTTLNSGTDYTLVATGQAGGTGGGVAFLSFSDDNTAPTIGGNVNFRVINASNASASVDVYIDQVPVTQCCQPGSARIKSLAYQSASSYVTMPWNSGGGGWQFYVTPANSTTPLIEFAIGGNTITQTTVAICTLVLTDVPNGTLMDSQPIILSDLNSCQI